MWKIIACAVGLALIGSSAVAQTQCNERAEVLKLLAQKYKESPIAAGVTSTGGLVEVLTNGKGETWTIIVTSPGDEQYVEGDQGIFHPHGDRRFPAVNKQHCRIRR